MPASAKMNSTLEHFCHPKHPLDYYAMVATYQSYIGFPTYRCSCDDIEGHDEPTLTLMKRVASFKCDACGEKAIDSCYKQIKENVSVIPSLKVMQNTNRKVIIANNLDMRYGNACSIRNFDPGGGTILASILSIEEGFLGLELKVHDMSSFISQEKAFCGHHKVMEVDIKEEFSEGTRLDRICAIERKALARVIMLTNYNNL
ncbi:hypothetical protein AgCh_025053 [Apium graveolens]